MAKAKRAMTMWANLTPCWMEEAGDMYNTWNSLNRYWGKLGVAVPEEE